MLNLFLSIINLLLCLHIHDADSVNVAFQLQDYIVAEAQVTLEVCATLIPPASISQLERNVFVNLSTAEGSATSSGIISTLDYNCMLHALY